MLMENFQLNAMLSKDSIELLELPLCKLLLMNDNQYPWFVLVPKVNDVQDIYQLDWQDQQQLLNESSMLSEILMQKFQGKKMNVAALGNICPQLHLHHIVRFEEDKAWPKPIWGLFPMKPYNEAEIEKIKGMLLPALKLILDK
ncbi:HIT domain-containing protein [Thalassotalea sp. 1_MG-2023]|uniref:HIT domain-containing protein n=1 Tax=Thalassotalea sp. 1_MG-2023 TaxID=3062680 RepID=UPI0026E24D8C|nr:HIT domain-containing protein [Thalassotalea sp. 1_MG-2023]MDO6428784.1 HIT domain-containing protein [Thalassotalea sp. 1_MG-2023]